MMKKYYRLGIAPLRPILPGLIFDNIKEAKQRAREENRIGEYKGRGVTVYESDKYGNIILPDNPGAVMNLTSQEKILFSAFRAHERLGRANIPGYFSEAIAELEKKGLIAIVPGSGKSPGGPFWEMTVKGRKFRGNPPRRKMYHLPYRYEIQFSEDGELFGQPLKFRSEQEISDFMKDYPRMKMESMRKLEPEISEENPPVLKRIISLVDIARTDQPETARKVIARDIWHEIKQAEESGRISTVDYALKNINEKLKGYGVEPLRGEFRGGYYGDIEALYVNRGDTYSTTILYDTRKKKFYITSWGDLVEREPKRFQNPSETMKGNPPLNWDKSVGDLGGAEIHLIQLQDYLESTKAPDKILHHLYRVKYLMGQVKGYLSRSHSADFKFNPNPPATEVYRDIIQIKAKKKDGRLYQHNFQPGSSIFGLSDGSILIKSRKGKKLWKDFPKGRK